MPGKDGWEFSDCEKQLGPALILTFFAMVVNFRAVVAYILTGKPM